MNTKKLYGSMVAIATPMFADGTLDFDALYGLIDFHIENGTTAIIAVGTTGESATIDNNEHVEVLRKTIAYANGRIAIIAGTGSNSTAEAIILTKKAKDAGADACLLVTPYYNKPTQEGLYQHYKTIAEVVDIEQILYNVPGRTAIDMLPETIARLAKIKNIVGVKDATGDLEVVKELIRVCPDDFMLYTGDDATAVEFILLGGHGGISVSANIAPKEVAMAYSAALKKDKDLARKINSSIASLHRDLFIESNPIPVKWALYKMGKCTNGIRLPLTILSVEAQKTLEKNLLSLGII